MGLDFKQDLKTKVVNYGKKQADALRSNDLQLRLEVIHGQRHLLDINVNSND